MQITKKALINYLESARIGEKIDINSTFFWLLAKYLRSLGYDNVGVGVSDYTADDVEYPIPYWYQSFLGVYFDKRSDDEIGSPLYVTAESLIE